MTREDFARIREKVYKEFMGYTDETQQIELIIKKRLNYEDCADLCIHARNVMTSKQGEYATENDVLHNFRVGSELTGEKMSTIAKMFQLKHTISILDIEKQRPATNMEYMFEKFGDWLNYQALIEACKIAENDKN